MPSATEKNRRPTAGIVATVFITFTVTVVGLVESVGKWDRLLHPTRVKITHVDVKPDTRSSNTRILVTSGTFRNVKDGRLLWLAIRPPNDSRIYPNGRPCDTNEDRGTWSCSVLFGTPTPGRSTPFHLIVMRADAQAVNAMLDYQANAGGSFPGLAGLPGGATKGEEIDVQVR